MRRSIAGVGAAAVGAATTAAVLVLGTATGLAAPGTSSAFGVSAEGALINIEPTPSVESTDGTEQNDSIVTVPLEGVGEVVVGGVKAGNDTASVRIVRATLGMEDMGLNLEVLKVACEGDTGTVSLVDLTVGGEQIVIPPADSNPVNQELEVPGVASIIYNQQISNPDGTFTVNGLVIDVAGAQKITLGSTTCGGPADGNGDGPAPTPSPIETDLPVTG